MTDIIIRPGEDAPGPQLPNHPTDDRYNPRVAQDHTGLRFDARPRRGPKSGDPYTDPTVLMSRPAFLECPADGCRSREFRVIADDSAAASSGLVQLLCARAGCRTYWPILQLQQPQVNDLLAKRLGLLVPTPGLAIDLTLGDDDD